MRENGHERERYLSGDPVIDKLEDVIDAVNEVGRKIEGIYQHMLKWLLVTVCVIALGNKGLELVQQWTGARPAAAAQE